MSIIRSVRIVHPGSSSLPKLYYIAMMQVVSQNTSSLLDNVGDSVPSLERYNIAYSKSSDGNASSRGRVHTLTSEEHINLNWNKTIFLQ